MPKFEKSTGYKMKGFTYPGKSPLKIASVSGTQLVASVGKTYDKYVNYGKMVGEPIEKAINKKLDPGNLKKTDEKVAGGAAKEQAKVDEGTGDDKPQPAFTGIKGTEGGDVNPETLKKLEKPELSKNFQQGLSGSSSGGFGSATLQ